MRNLAVTTLLCAVLAMGGTMGCSNGEEGTGESVEETVVETQDTVTTLAGMRVDGVLDTTDLFTQRDLEQTADLSEATFISIEDGQDVTIDQEGVYVLSGNAQEATVIVDADDAAKVQLVLDGLTVSNSGEPVIYVASADKVFITTAEGSVNTLTVTGNFGSSLGDNVDGVIFSKDEITLNGLGTLVIQSSGNGIVGKDDVKVTGGNYQVTASNHAIQGKDSVRIADGSFDLTATKDGIHAENSDDPSLGYVYICGGGFTITAGSDGIEGDAVVQVDGGSFSIDASEGIEGTTVQVNDGVIGISASDDGINATAKSSAYPVTIEINGGSITIQMGAGDTDALDSNGNLIINGGSIDITAQSPFDYDGIGELNGGTVTVNGQVIDQLYNQMMGGDMGMMDGQMGQPGDMGGQGGPGGMPGGQGGMPGGGM